MWPHHSSKSHELLHFFMDFLFGAGIVPSTLVGKPQNAPKRRWSRAGQAWASTKQTNKQQTAGQGSSLPTMSCLYLIQQPQYRTITCRLSVSSQAFYCPPWPIQTSPLVFDTATLNIALSLVVSLHRLPPRLFILTVVSTSCLYLIQQFSHPPCSYVNSCFHCLLPFFRVLVLFEMVC